MFEIETANNNYINKKKLKLIGVSEENYLRLKKCGLAGDSFNDVITELLRKHAMDGIQVIRNV